MNNGPNYPDTFFMEICTGGFQTRPYELLAGSHK